VKGGFYPLGEHTSSSQSDSFSTTLDSIGDSRPPCGVPSSVATLVPSGITTPALSIYPISPSTLLSWILSDRFAMSR
jgi:hypothetical protein